MIKINQYEFDHVITVSAPEEIRIERLRKRGLSATQIEQRMKAQASDSDRESIADSVIINDKGEDSLFTQVETIWHKLEDANRSKK